MISVIIPSYNQGKFFKNAIESLKTQTYKDLEIIVVDDKSIDGSWEMAKEFLVNGEIHRLIRLDKNGGIPHAFNEGLKQATGEYVIVLSQDDELAPECLEDMLKKMEDPAVGVVASGMMLIGDENGEIYPQTTWDINTLKQSNQIFGSSLVRKKCYDELGGWDEKADMCSDWEMWCRICNAGWKLGYVSKPVYRFRRHPNQISNSIPQETLDYVRNKYA